MHAHLLSQTEIQNIRRYFLLQALQNLEADGMTPATLIDLREEILFLMKPHFPGLETSVFMSSEHSTRNLLDHFEDGEIVQKLKSQDSGRESIAYKPTAKTAQTLAELQKIIPKKFLETTPPAPSTTITPLTLEDFQAFVDNPPAPELAPIPSTTKKPLTLGDFQALVDTTNSPNKQR